MKYLATEWSDEDLEGYRAIIVPSGIGEMQWAYAKYINCGERLAILGLDGAPRRLHQFCELLPTVDVFGYSSQEYSTIREWQKFHELYSWRAVTDAFPLGCKTMLACNPHLEAGKPLATWLPDLPTTYRYPLNLTDKHYDVARSYLRSASVGDLLIGISCASYRGSTAWKTWGATQWEEFLTLLQRDYPETKFVLLGGAWDDLTADLFDSATELRWLVNAYAIPPVGRTHFGAAAAILQKLHGYIGFSSGLGHVAAHCCACPTFMLWPNHEIEKLSTTWVDPELFDSGFYVPSGWNSPEDVYKLAKPWLRRITDGRYT